MCGRRERIKKNDGIGRCPCSSPFSGKKVRNCRHDLVSLGNKERWTFTAPRKSGRTPVVAAKAGPAPSFLPPLTIAPCPVICRTRSRAPTPTPLHNATRLPGLQEGHRGLSAGHLGDSSSRPDFGKKEGGILSEAGWLRFCVFQGKIYSYCLRMVSASQAGARPKRSFNSACVIVGEQFQISIRRTSITGSPLMSFLEPSS